MKNLFLKGINKVNKHKLLEAGEPYWIYDYDVAQKLDDQGEKLKALVVDLNLIQLRIKSLQGSELKEQARTYACAIRKINPECAIIMNDHIELALELQLDGVHLGQSDDSVIKARETLGAESIIGLTVRSLEEADEAEKLYKDELIDYIGSGTVFETTTKQGLVAKGPGFIQEVQKRIPTERIYPIGGITAGNIDQLKAIDVKHVALCSELFRNSVNELTI